MLEVRRSEERGRAQEGWLDSFFTFSFAGYHDPAFMGFRDLRVINEDRIQGGAGFPLHGHQNMEIITYIVEGTLQHKDTLGSSAVIRPGEVQRMTAGRGIRHSEYNPHASETAHLLQIWILPESKGLEPDYEQKDFSRQLARGTLTLVASRDGRDGSVRIHQDVDLYAAKWPRAHELHFQMRPGRAAWLQVVEGDVQVNDVRLAKGDAAAVSDEDSFILKAQSEAQFLLFDLR